MSRRRPFTAATNTLRQYCNTVVMYEPSHWTQSSLGLSAKYHATLILKMENVEWKSDKVEWPIFSSEWSGTPRPLVPGFLYRDRFQQPHPSPLALISRHHQPQRTMRRIQRLPVLGIDD